MHRPLAALLALAVLVLPMAAQADGRHNRHRSLHGSRYDDYRGRDCWIERDRRGHRVYEVVRCRHRGYGPPGWAAAPRYVVPPQPPQVVVVPSAPPAGPVYGEPYQDRSGRYCREYQTTGRIGGRQERLYGTACLMPDGSWQLDR